MYCIINLIQIFIISLFLEKKPSTYSIILLTLQRLNIIRQALKNP